MVDGSALYNRMNVFKMIDAADAMVSTGLAALGYEYINLGSDFSSSSDPFFFILSKKDDSVNSSWADDCWAELNRDPQVQNFS